MERAGELGGHKDSVLCCDVGPGDTLLASGGEDGTMCTYDLRARALTGRYTDLGGDAVPAVCFSPVDEHSLYVASECAVSCIDLRKGPGGEAACQKYEFNQEEVNQVAVNAKGQLLAAADDSGEVKIIDLAQHKLQKTLAGAHNNICTGVSFRARKPWEVVTGGMDCQVVRWDFSRGRPLATFKMGGEAETESETESQMYNPPLVHAIAAPTEDTPLSSSLLAVARGDGHVAVLGLEDGGKRKGKGGGDVVPEGLACLLGREAGGHTTSVSHVAWSRFAGPERLISGGNDGCVKLWAWREAAGGSGGGAGAAAAGAPLAASVEHGPKVNWLASSGRGEVVVADTTCKLAIYSVSG